MSLVTKVSVVYVYIATASLLVSSTKSCSNQVYTYTFLRALASGLLLFCLISYIIF